MKINSNFISVIIPTLGRASINDTLNALKKQTRLPDEILVIKDSERRGVSWAKNEGVRKAKGNLIAFIDDDCIPDNDWLDRLITALDKFKASVSGGTYTETDALLRDSRKRRNFPEKEEIDNMGFVGAGGNVIYKRTWLDKCKEKDGYVFNENFTTGEDHELVARLKKYGATFVFVPSNPKHLKKVTFWSYQTHQFYRGIGIACLHITSRHDKTFSPSHKSLLWGKKINISKKIFGILWWKILGPFDIKSFTSLRNFLAFWIGEKAQGIGFLYRIFRYWENKNE